jgi:hypothetical protein
VSCKPSISAKSPTNYHARGNTFQDFLATMLIAPLSAFVQMIIIATANHYS